MRVLICGDRNWTDEKTIEEYIKTLPPQSVVINGMCRGVDKIARRFALKHGHSTMDFPAKWGKFGRAAGPIRNRQMILDGEPDLVIAFHNNLTESKGTKDMLEQAGKASIESILYRSGDFDIHSSTQDEKIICPKCHGIGSFIGSTDWGGSQTREQCSYCGGIGKVQSSASKEIEQ